jgi:hypothetical protein
VVVFCRACGTVLGAAMGRYQGQKTGGNAPPRGPDGFAPRDVLLADRYFGGHCDLA